jgi:hypothetical protein
VERERRNDQLTFSFKRRSLRLASLTTAEISHAYALWSVQPVVNSFPSAENDTQYTRLSCWRAEPMGWLFSRFHNRAVLSQDVLARIRPFGEIAMPLTTPVCPLKTALRRQVVQLFHVQIESFDPEISVLPSAVQARQYTGRGCSLRFATSLPVFTSQILRYSSWPCPPVAIMVVSGE